MNVVKITDSKPPFPSSQLRAYRRYLQREIRREEQRAGIGNLTRSLKSKLQLASLIDKLTYLRSEKNQESTGK